MGNRSGFKGVRACAILTLLSGLPLLGQGQNQATIEALLSEVRQLRIALERSAVTVPRIQVALQKMQIQQGRVDQISQRLQEFRTRVSSIQTDDARITTELRQAEQRVSQEVDPVRRKMLEQQVQHFNNEAKVRSGQIQAANVQEIELSSQLRTEQSKLDVIVQQLSQLEASLASQTPRN